MMESQESNCPLQTEQILSFFFFSFVIFIEQGYSQLGFHLPKCYNFTLCLIMSSI